MSAPRLADDSHHGRLAIVARRWAHLIVTTAYVPIAQQELEPSLRNTLALLWNVVRSQPFSSEPASEAGRELVEMQCTGTDTIRRSVEMLARVLLTMPDRSRPEEHSERVVLTLGAMMSGYSDALRQATQKRQQGLHETLVKTAQEARRHQLASEAQFSEVLASSVDGVAITELDGRFVRINAALSRTLDRSTAEISEHTLFDVVHPDDVGCLRSAYQELLTERSARVRQTCRLVRKDGSPVWSSFVGSLAYDLEGMPNRVVTVMTDDTEVSLLQSQLSHQALHDALTGLPNRQFFTTRLEKALRRAPQDTGITLFHLDLDGFSSVANGFGPAVANRFLKSVAERLRLVLANETAMVARFNADEFGVLLENTPTTPNVIDIIDKINEELSEPAYLDGHHGLATSASIGVVHRPWRGSDPADLLRAADMTLRRAKRSGRRQWQLFDPEHDTADRRTSRLAVTMPGAWEIGDIEVVYRPVVSLTSDSIPGVEARLRWNHPEFGILSHDQCVALAEKTGLILPLGGWLMRSACERLRRWRQESGQPLWLGVQLTTSQAADPDLVAGIRHAVDATGFPPEQLCPGIPVQALATDSNEAADNLKVLLEIGVPTALHEFGSVGEVVCLEDWSVRSVRIARHLVQRQAARANQGSLVDPAITHLVGLAHRAGATVTVDGVRCDDQADWWRQIGADLAVGDLFRETPTGLPPADA
jgi:diguanylate cyclase (GGDEF)-like protein/PAS domain S-box-containing protein